MIKCLLLSFSIFLSVCGTAQTAGLNYVRNLGGNQDDILWGNVVLRSGNLVSVGHTKSTDRDAAGNHGDVDCFVTCTSPAGTLLWKKILGGTRWDGYTSALDPTADGNVVVGFTTNSADGDIAGNSGSWDIALFKLTPDGNLIWSKRYGGAGADILGKLKGTPDGNIIVTAASSSSGSGTVTVSNHGLSDLLVFKLDANGNILWQKMYGGTNDEAEPVVALAPGGGYFFAATTASTDGDLAGVLLPTTPIGGSDMWLLRTDTAGNIVWSKVVGGSGNEVSPVLYATGTSEYLGINTTSSDRDFSTNLGLQDIALFKFNASGSLLWKKQYASGAFDYLGAMTGFNDDMITLTGGNYSFSFAGYPMPSADERLMIFRVDSSNGSIKWMKALGGSGRSQGNAASFNKNGELFISGLSTNVYGDIYANRGGYDAVVVSFAAGNRLTGTVFLDANNNNQADASEVKPNLVMMETKKSTGFYEATTTRNGVYNLDVDTGSYTTKPQFRGNPYYTATPDSFLHTFSGNGEVYSQNFALHAVPNVKDLAVSLTPINIFRPGRPAQYVLTGYNVGTTVINSGTLGFKKDPALSYAGFSTPPAYQSGDSVYWNFNSLVPFDSLSIVITMNVPISTLMGTPMNYVLYINPVLGDSTPANNLVYFRHIVVNSFDPNCKTNNMADSLPLAMVQNDGYIYYTIQFQNTGTASAIDIIVKDTLSDKLRDSTFEIVRSSHPFGFSLLDHVATWKFFNINLPDSNANEALSHGYVQYRIKAKPALVPGDYITNSAAIYFDFNEPVITETNKLTVYIPVVAAPVISPSGTVSSCLPVLLTANTGTGYQWFKNGTVINGATGSSYLAAPPGSYTATATVNGFSSNPSTATIVNAANIDTVVISKSGNVLSVQSPDAGAAYTWQKQNGQLWADLSPAVNGTSYQVTVAGAYRVSLAKGICHAVSNSEIWEPISIPGDFKERLYPDPADNFVKVDSLSGKGWTSIEIVNAAGRQMIRSLSITALSELTISTAAFPSGVYLLVLRNSHNGAMKSMKFMKR